MTSTTSRPALRTALVGYGYAGRTLHAPLLAATPGFDLAAICSTQARVAATDWPQCTVMTFEQLLTRDDVDLIVLATPSATHAPLALAALDAGKHVVVDKPFTPTLAEARRLVTVAADRNRLVTAFHNRRWDGDFITVRQLVDSGTLGHITTFESRFDRYRPEVRDRWRERPGPAAGTWFDLGPHLVDQALLLFGLPVAVHADFASQRTGASVTDCFHVLLRYDSLRVILASSYLATLPGPRFRILGTAGSYHRNGEDSQEAALRAGSRPVCGQDWGANPDPGTLQLLQHGAPLQSALPTAAGDYRQFYRSLRDAIHGQAASPVPTRDILDVARVIEAAALSAAQHREVPLTTGCP